MKFLPRIAYVLRWPTVLAVLLTMALGVVNANAALLAIQNASFEDDDPGGDEFFFGVPPQGPAGWFTIDPNNLLTNPNNVTGILNSTLSPAFFVSGATDGDQMAIIFIGADEGGGEVGIGQTLGTALTPNTRYTLSVDVGNIGSGVILDGTAFVLDGFPGYRIELRAGAHLLASVEEDTDTTGGPTPDIPDREFANVTLVHTSGDAPLGEGESLEIRLINRNLIDPDFPGSDSEVDFDRVILDATAVPLPGAGWLLLGACAPLLIRRRRSTLPSLGP